MQKALNTGSWYSMPKKTLLLLILSIGLLLWKCFSCSLKARPGSIVHTLQWLMMINILAIDDEQSKKKKTSYNNIYPCKESRNCSSSYVWHSNIHICARKVEIVHASWNIHVIVMIGYEIENIVNLALKISFLIGYKTEYCEHHTQNISNSITHF